MKNIFLPFVIILFLTSGAFAAVGLSWTITSLGGGLYATDVSMYDTSDYAGSFSTYNLCLSAGSGLTFNQNKAYGTVDVDTESDAIEIEGVSGSGYDKATDTWYYDVTAAWNEVVPYQTDVTGTTLLTLNNLGTAYGYDYQGTVPLIHIVSEEGYICIDGAISRVGVTYPISFVVHSPEPAAMSLLGVGALALLRRRSR